MRRLYSIGKPVSLSETDTLHQLGGQGNTILTLAESGVDFLPGFLVSVKDLREDFDGIFTIIWEDGIHEIELATDHKLKNDQSPLPLKVSLLPDVMLEPNPENQVPEASAIQLRQAVGILVDDYHADLLNHSLPAAVMIQYVPRTDEPEMFVSKHYTSRDPLSGNKLRPDRTSQLPREEVARLEKAAAIVELKYLDIRQIEYITDNGRVWITGQSATERLAQARLKLLADLFRQGRISNRDYVKALSPEELGTLFSPTSDPTSTANLIKMEGGLAGSPGAASGLVFFSAAKLKKAYQQSELQNRNTDFILLREATHAEDLEAIRLSQGVITSRGGYTSHAPIVARYLGKPAVINPDIKHLENKVTLQGQMIEEGQPLTIDIQAGENPVIYIGKADIQEARHDSEDLKTLLDQAGKLCHKTQIRANVDTEDEAHLARQYGAAGIGLCRTEHMMMAGGTLEKLQKLIICEDELDKKRLLADLDTFLATAFLTLFRIMDGLPVAIRLLDAPLNEFLPDMGPHGLLQKQTNPMLGHRGCRLGISLPELYEMQIHAILTAALQATTEEKITVQPDILIPFVMSHREMAILRKGHTSTGHDIKGINAVIRETAETAGLEKLPFECRIGAVIEVPAAALSAAKIVHQAEIISFGTNDLTQTTLGVSRDDIGSMLQLYEELNIWEGDPFQDLVEPVKQQIEQAVDLARAVRPDLETGICGEAGNSRDTIRFAIHLGLDYISCAARKVPMTLLTAAQIQMENSI